MRRNWEMTKQKVNCVNDTREAGLGHAILSASSAHRWLNCSPAPRLELEFEDQESTAAAQGTAAHNFCEHKLKKALNIRSKRPISKFHDDEMEEHSDDYVALVNALSKHLGLKAKYLGVPSFAYEIGEFTITREGKILNKAGDEMTLDEIREPSSENEFDQIEISFPLEGHDARSIRNLLNMVYSKEPLIKKVYSLEDYIVAKDITAFVLVFPPEDEDDKYAILPYFWLPEETLDLRVRRDHVNYDLWERQGYIKTTEGNVVHYGFIENFIEELGMEYNIREIAFDRWGAIQMTQNLEGMGFTVVPFGQGFKDMSPPTKELMKLTLEEKLAHGGHPVLRWMMDNIFVRTDPAGNVKPDKEKSSEKIDGAVATIMALDRALRNDGVNTGSVYDERGILVF